MVTTVNPFPIPVTAVSGSLALIAVLILLVLLIQKELTTALVGDRQKKFGRMLNIGIVPLFLAFVLIVFFKVLEVLR